jgi:hypothetical protein
MLRVQVGPVLVRPVNPYINPFWYCRAAYSPFANQRTPWYVWYGHSAQGGIRCHSFDNRDVTNVDLALPQQHPFTFL